MTLDEMTEAEKLALAGLLRLMVKLDGSFTAEEADALGDVAAELGEEPFWRLLEDFDPRAHADIRDLARAVTRREAQEIIYGHLYGVATTQTITDRENQLLDWLASTWQIQIDELAD